MLCRLLLASGFALVRPHFRLFSLVTAGRDETAALREHIRFYLALFKALSRAGFVLHEPLVELSDPTLQQEVFDPLAAEFPGVQFGCNPDRKEGAHSYSGVMLRICPMNQAGERHPIVDGGFTDWTARLLQNRKACRRFMPSAQHA